MKKLLQINPEIARYLWTEITRTRLLVVPCVYFAIFWLFSLQNAWGSFSEVVHSVSGYILIGVLFFWGARVVSEAISVEIRERTWETQKLTSLSSWQMSLGKLFGSTVFVWYAAAIAIVFFAFTSLTMYKADEELKVLLIILLGAIFVHSLSLILSILSIQKNPLKEKHRNSIGFLLIVLMGISGFSFLSAYSSFSYHFGSYGPSWYNLGMDPLNFGILSLMAYCTWALFGLNHIMRAELRYKNTHKLWISFLLFSIFYGSGFLYGIAAEEYSISDYLPLMISQNAFLTIISFCYITIFLAAKNPIAFLRIKDRLQNKKSFFNELPAWVISLGMAIPALLIVIICSITLEESGPMESLLNRSYSISSTWINSLAILLFLIRDIALILFLNLNPQRKRADGTAIFFLALLYGLVPALLSAAGQISSLQAFWPVQNGFAGIFPVLIECIVMLALFKNRWDSQVKV